jgi:hypothetical protein
MNKMHCFASAASQVELGLGNDKFQNHFTVTCAVCIVFTEESQHSPEKSRPGCGPECTALKFKALRVGGRGCWDALKLTCR